MADVQVVPEAPTRMVSCRLPVGLLESIDAMAAQAGVTRTAWMASALEAAVGPQPGAAARDDTQGRVPRGA